MPRSAWTATTSSETRATSTCHVQSSPILHAGLGLACVTSPSLGLMKRTWRASLFSWCAIAAVCWSIPAAPLCSGSLAYLGLDRWSAMPSAAGCFPCRKSGGGIEPKSVRGSTSLALIQELSLLSRWCSERLSGFAVFGVVEIDPGRAKRLARLSASAPPRLSPPGSLTWRGPADHARHAHPRSSRRSAPRAGRRVAARAFYRAHGS